jgi:hypothetical protein
MENLPRASPVTVTYIGKVSMRSLPSQAFTDYWGVDGRVLLPVRLRHTNLFLASTTFSAKSNIFFVWSKVTLSSSVSS